MLRNSRIWKQTNKTNLKIYFNKYTDFIFPFLGHAVGTLVGAVIAAVIASNKKMRMALIVGVLFLLGGIAVNIMIPGPIWFTATDIIVAYIPMAFLGGKIGTLIKPEHSDSDSL